MKKKLTRILAFILIAMMLVPTLATFAVSAEGETEETVDISDIVNVYELNKLDSAPSTVNKDGEVTEETGMLASKAFEITHASNGDRYIYVGPCPDPRGNGKIYNDLIAYWYKGTGAAGGSPKKIGELQDNIIDEFPDGSVILKIKVVKISGAYAKYAALKLPNTFSEYILATCERPFTVKEYYAYADAQGWDIESVGLRIPPPAIAEEMPEDYEGLWNLFQTKATPDTSATQNSAANVYVQSNFIKVVPGDTITMGAISTKETQTILYEYDADFNEIRKYKKGDYGIDFVKAVGNDYAIYSHVIPARPVDKDGNLINPDAKEVAYVKVLVPIGIYNDNDILVTKNQPFDRESFREALEIAEPSADVKAHAFYGKKALFIGDSISYGDYDTPASYTNPSTSYARRLALATGLVPTNISAPGATVGKTGKPNVKYEWNLLRTALMETKTYDMVIFQGGINDARQNIAIGEALPATTAREILVESTRVATFTGGLQLMFYDAITQWPEAEFYYVADHKVSADVTGDKDMSAYYAQAKALCAAYGVHYIDLYDDAEINQILTDNAGSDLYADDHFTPTKTGYDLLFPTVLRLFNEVYVCVDHVYSNNCDESCNNCGHIRVIEHAYNNGCDNECNICGVTRITEHIYDNACDAKCNECGNTRTVAHKTSIFRSEEYHWFGCEYCGEVSAFETHIYDSETDAMCNICGATRVIEDSTIQPEEEATTIPEDVTSAEPEMNIPEGTAPEGEEITTSGQETPNDTTPDSTDKVEEEEHVCEEVSILKAFWNMIMNFFRRLFGQSELCDCGDTIKK